MRLSWNWHKIEKKKIFFLQKNMSYPENLTLGLDTQLYALFPYGAICEICSKYLSTMKFHFGNSEIAKNMKCRTMQQVFLFVFLLDLSHLESQSAGLFRYKVIFQVGLPPLYATVSIFTPVCLPVCPSICLSDLLSSVCLSICLFVRHAPYLRNHISSDLNVWYT